MEQTKSLKKNAILNTIRTVMKLIFPLITFPYASRILLPEALGKVNFANSIVSYFGILASLGIVTYGIRGAAQARNDRAKLSKFVKEVLTINFISTAVAYILFFISLFVVPKFHDYKVLLCISATTILLTTLGMEWLYSALEEYKYITLRSIFFQIISLVFLFVFVRTKDDYLKYAAFGIISSTGSNICNFIHSRKYIDLNIKVHLELKKHIKSILILFASSIAISIFTILDTSMLGFLSTDIQVGYYSAASKISRMIRDLFPAITTVLFARMSFYVSSKDENKIVDLTGKTLNFILCFSIPIVCGILILANPLIELLCGQSFLLAIQSLKFLTPLIFFSSISCFLGGQLLISYGKDKEYLIVEIIAAAVDLSLNFIYIPKYGSAGASFATLVTEIIIFIFFCFFTKKILIQIKILKNLIQYFVSSAVMSFAVYFIQLLFSNMILKLLIPTAIGIVVYGICLYIFKNIFFLSLIGRFNIVLSKIKKIFNRSK